MGGHHPPPSSVQLIGCDFTSAPTRRKPIVVAAGAWRSAQVVGLVGMEHFTGFDVFSQWLRQPAHWVGGFDLPFGLPRELVEHLGWPGEWHVCMQHYAGLSRAQIRAQFAAFCAQRPVGAKFAHRAADVPAGSSPSMKWVNPPVAYMMHAGVPLLLDAGVQLPGLHEGDARRVALEAYPGWLARSLIGRRSYKSDDRSKQTVEREEARRDLVRALHLPLGALDGLRLESSASLADALVADASGDCLDAVLCMLEAAWGHQRFLAGDGRYGLPEDMDPLEGWIVAVPWHDLTGRARFT